MNKTQLFAKSEKELSPYFAVYREFLTATGWKGWEQVKVKTPENKLVPTGEVVEVVYPFSCEDKLLWCWMLDRFQFFKDGKNVWFDNQDEIAAYTGISVSTVKRFIKKLSVSGVLVIKAKPMGGARVSNSYVITKDLELVQPDNIVKKASTSPVVERSEQVDSQVAPTPKQPVKAVENVVEEIKYRTEPQPEPDDASDDFEFMIAMADSAQQSKVEAPTKPTKIIFETTAQFISTNFKQWTTKEAMDVLEANGVRNADTVLKSHGGCKILGEWFTYDSKQGYFTSEECPF